MDLLWFSRDSNEERQRLSDSLVTQAPIKAELWILPFLSLPAGLFPTMHHCWLMREDSQIKVTLLKLAA